MELRSLLVRGGWSEVAYLPSLFWLYLPLGTGQGARVKIRLLKFTLIYYRSQRAVISWYVYIVSVQVATQPQYRLWHRPDLNLSCFISSEY